MSLCEVFWRLREIQDVGAACCLVHFESTGRSACRADRRLVEDCSK